MAREGGSRFFLYTYVERGWEGEGEGVDFFLQIHYERAPGYGVWREEEGEGG